MKTAPLTIQQAIERAPAIATNHPHPYKGEGFVHINTQHVLETMLDYGFAIHRVAQARGAVTLRGVDTGLYNQHVIRLREAKYFNDTFKEVGDVIPELVLRNAHDGSGSFFESAGLFRLICTNGFIVSETAAAKNYPLPRLNALQIL